MTLLLAGFSRALITSEHRRVVLGETMLVANASDRGRESFERQAWGMRWPSCGRGSGAALELEDLERLVVAAYLVGRTATRTTHGRAHHECQRLLSKEHCAIWRFPRQSSV